MAFAATAWAALLTALVCALVPLGAPAGRAIGSAFDPTTSVVTLDPGTRLAGIVKKRVAPRPAGGADGPAQIDQQPVLLRARAAAIPVRAPRSPLFAASHSAGLPAEALPPLGPRAPPFA